MRKLHTILVYILAISLALSFDLEAQTVDDFEKRGEYYFQQCENFTGKDADSITYYSQLAMAAFEKAGNWKRYVDGLNALCASYYLAGNYTLYQKNALRAITEAEQHLGAKSRGMSDALSNYSIFLREIGDHKKSVQYLNRSLEIENALESKQGKTATLINLGTVYFRMGDYDEALKYYMKVIALGKENPEVLSTINRANTYRHIGNVFIEKKELNFAKFNFRKCLGILSTQNWDLKNRGHDLKIGANQDMAEVFLEQGQSDSVHYYIKRSIDLSKGVCANRKERAYEILGELSLLEGKYQSSIDYFLKSKEIVLDKFSAYEKHYSFAEKDIFLAKTYQAAKDFKPALTYYQKAIQMLSHDDLGDDVYRKPELDHIYSQLNFLRALSGKANTFFEIYQHENSRKDLDAAYETFQLAAQLIQEIRQDYQDEGSLLRLSTTVLPIYENAIEVAVILNRITGEEKYLEDAFGFSESNKAILLLESMNESKAKSFAGIPDSLLEKEHRLRVELSFLKRKLNEEINKSNRGQEKIRRNLNAQIFDVDQEYKALILNLENKYPAYHQLKHNTRLASVEEVRQKIGTQATVFVEYFLGGKNTYVFSITSQEIKVHQINGTGDLLVSIREMRHFLSHPPQMQNARKSFDAYAQCAQLLFQKLLASSIPEGIERLVIVADDQLGYLPFGVLLMDEPKEDKPLYALKNLSYLLEAYEISYSYSATLFVSNNSLKREKADKVFLGIAPSFRSPLKSAQRLCNEQNLYGLKCNQNEVKAIQELLGGQTLVAEDASKVLFEKEVGQCQILHMATHACLDDQNPRFSKIYLTDHYISNNDLYNLQLNSDLAVLSACDTGAGQLAKGEGVMSLARGFIHAGCPSVVMSLWSVDDCATSDIMIDFYEKLYAGQTKSEAIRQAKIDYIATALKADQHPYYWAAFVQIGNYDQMSFSKSSFNFNSRIFFAVLLFLLVLFFFRKRNPVS